MITPVRPGMAVAAALMLNACAPGGSVANAAEDLENASEAYANRTDARFEKIGNELTPQLANTIDRFDGNATDNASSNATSKR